MPEYRRTYVQGGTIFLTLVTYQRQPIFINLENIAQFRSCLATVRDEMPFEIDGAVVLPDHVHFIWTLPIDDQNYSQRIGRLKVLFTRSLGGKTILPESISASRRKHRESNVWQRRFWEHTIRDEADFENHLNYIHYNPVKHGLVACPHLWLYSSFHKYVRKGIYAEDWCCVCAGEKMNVPSFEGIVDKVGE